MDSTLAALIARFPRLAWRAEADHHVGERGQIVVTVWDDGGDIDSWRATGSGGPVWVATRGGSAVDAVEKLAAEVQLSAALHAAPADVEDWGDPNMPGPAALGCPALAAIVGLVGMAGGALVLGMAAMRWLTGGAS